MFSKEFCIKVSCIGEHLMGGTHDMPISRAGRERGVIVCYFQVCSITNIINITDLNSTGSGAWLMRKEIVVVGAWSALRYFIFFFFFLVCAPLFVTFCVTSPSIF
ncbi:unnamed protein product [Arabidopsis halleri]